MMDLLRYTQSNTAEIVLVDPVDGKEMDAGITVYGTHTDEFRAAFAAHDDKQLTPDDLSCLVLADITVGFRNLTEDDVDLVFSKEVALDLYRRHRWLRLQIDRGLLELQRFFPNYANPVGTM